MKNKILCGLSAVLILGGALACLLVPQKDYSESERRPLADFPDFSVESVLNGKFMAGFEDYALDAFPLRDVFRAMKAKANGLFGKKDNNDFYIVEGNAVKMEYPLREESLTHATQRFQAVYDRYLQGMKVYQTVVPDKNYFYGSETGHLQMDYSAMTEFLKKGFPQAQYLDLFSLLSKEDYYHTDPHWRQERLVPVASALFEGMGLPASGQWKESVLNDDFKGAYSGQTGLPLKKDALTVLEQPWMQDCVVYDHQNNRQISFYDMEKATGRDPYETYLSGSLSLISVENPKATTDRELILFRDSFGSAIAPLLAEHYKKITLVDIRYIQPAMLEQFIEFKDQDVLFLYSTLVPNTSETLK